MIVEKDGFIDCNQKTLELFNIASKEEFTKLHPSDLSPEFQPDGEASYDKSLKLMTLSFENGYQRFEWIHRKADGEDFPTEIILTSFELHGERVLQATVRDMTEKVRLEKSLDEERKLVVHQSKLASLGQLAAGVGHEINNPVAIIKGYMSILEQELKDNKYSHANAFQMIKNINIASDRIAVIVKGLRTFTRSDNEQLVVFSLREVFLESINLVSEIFHREGVVLEIEIEETKSFELIGNRGRMAQVIINLLANAKDASEDSSDRRIRISLTCLLDVVRLVVTDSGKGIPLEIRDKIFDPFFTTKDVNKGTGIGLSIVNSIVKEHEGKIHFETTPGAGTSFIVELPLHF